MRPYHTDPALDSRASMGANPYNSTTDLFLAKVVQVHPDAGTVDVALDTASGQGGFYSHVPVMSWSYGSLTGQTYMPTIDLTAPVASAQGVYDQPIGSGKQDIWCVCGHLSGRAQRAVCLGFLSPLQSQVHTQSVGMDVNVHESGVYKLTTKDGHLEVHLPDGSYIIIATGTTTHDMTQENSAWNPVTTTTPYNVTMRFNGAVNLTVNGDATINAAKVTLGTTNGSGAAVARVGDTVTNGVISSGSTKVFAG